MDGHRHAIVEAALTGNGHARFRQTSVRLPRSGSDPGVWKNLTNIDAIPIRICQHETPEPEVGIAQGLDDPNIVGRAVLIKDSCVFDHEVRYII